MLLVLDVLHFLLKLEVRVLDLLQLPVELFLYHHLVIIKRRFQAAELVEAVLQD